MGLPSWLIAFTIGLAFTLWLAARGVAPRAARWLRGLALGATLVAASGAGVLLWQAFKPGPAPAAAEAEPTLAPQWSGARLIIADLGVDQKVRRVPVHDGRWDISQLDQQVGLLTATGQHPDDGLAMVLTGHVSLPPSVPGPFANLFTLQPVSKIIYRVGGTDYLYAVEEQVTLAPSESAKLVVPDGKQLLLVTCTNWDYLSERYLGRLMVRAIEYDRQPSPVN
jgi:LPXTG-site transpeptidase (sortase) family protein